MEGNLLILAVILWPVAAGVLAYAVGRKSPAARDWFVLGAVAADFVAVLLLPRSGALFLELPGIAGATGLGFQLDGFRWLFCVLALFLWLVTTVFSREYFHSQDGLSRYYLFLLWTLGATLGVFLSGDLLTLFVFFEILSFVSYPLVVHDGSPGALRAGQTYLAVAVICGMVMLMGIFLLQGPPGLMDSSLRYLIGILLLIGFGAKAGMFPLHIWLPKAHPVAPAPASALLSGILTKTGVFGILITSAYFAGDVHEGAGDPAWGLILLVPAVITMVLGAVLALFSTDLKRTLACSSVSQIGFILVGGSMQSLLAPHQSLAVWGTILHMVNHSLLKLVLFVAAGIVYRNLHSLDLNDIRGFGRGKPLFTGVFLMGALGISGVPLWNGYVSKTLLHESLVEAVHLYHGQRLEGLLQLSEWLFLLAGGLTVAYMTKLCVVLLVEKPREALPKARYVRPPTAVLLGVTALLLPVMGALPHRAMEPAARLGQEFLHGHEPDHAVHYFEWINMQGAVISLAVGAALYFLVVRTWLSSKDAEGVRIYHNRWPAWLDLENLVYRPVLAAVTWVLFCLGRVADTLVDGLVSLLLKTVLKPSRPKLFPGRFLSRFYWYFHPSPRRGRERFSVINTFSYGLLLFGVGLCVVLLVVFAAAFR